jgi:hypothetical protein
MKMKSWRQSCDEKDQTAVVCLESHGKNCDTRENRQQDAYLPIEKSIFLAAMHVVGMFIMQNRLAEEEVRRAMDEYRQLCSKRLEIEDSNPFSSLNNQQELQQIYQKVVALAPLLCKIDCPCPGRLRFGKRNPCRGRNRFVVDIHERSGFECNVCLQYQERGWYNEY